MKKFLLLLAAAYLGFAAEFSMREYKTPLISVDEGVGTIIDGSDIVVGSSGVVMHKSEGSQSSSHAKKRRVCQGQV